MLSIPVEAMEKQIAVNDELQRLFAQRTNKLKELLEIEQQINLSASKIQQVACYVSPTQLVSNMSAPKAEYVSDLDEMGASNAAVADEVSDSQTVMFTGREMSLPSLIARFLKGKKHGESLSSIVQHCLSVGYKSDSSDFTRSVTQALYNLKVKKVIFKDKITRKWILD
jgi:hypothetical protein